MPISNQTLLRDILYKRIESDAFTRIDDNVYILEKKDRVGDSSICMIVLGDIPDAVVSSFHNKVDCLISLPPKNISFPVEGSLNEHSSQSTHIYTDKTLYMQASSEAKSILLKPGCFCVEFLPEENGDNYRYLFQIKEMARKAGLEYYAKVPWSKQGFVANTGRKSKNTEDICFFTKGRARALRPNAQKDKADPGEKHYMSGAAGMLPVSFDFAAPSRRDKLHQAEKPIDLIKEILRYVSLEGETVLDQFAGSGVVGDAALETGRNSILFEKDPETFEKIAQRLKVLGEIEAVTPGAKELVSLGTDAIIAQDAFRRTGDRSILKNFVETHTIDPAALYDAEHELREAARYDDVSCKAISEAMEAIEVVDLCAEGLDLMKESPATPVRTQALVMGQTAPKVLECSSHGDRRFSALFAMVTIKGREKSIEEWYQNAKRTADGKRAGKGKPFDHIICPFTGDKLPAKEASNLYKGLWITYLSKNPDLVEYASGFDEFHDMFKGKKTVNCQADAIAAYVKNQDSFVNEVRHTPWYQNMASKRKPSLSSQIDSASSRAGTASSGKSTSKDFSFRN